MDAEAEPRAGASFFIGETPDGKKYLGMNVSVPMINVSVVIASQEDAPEMIRQLREAVREMNGQPKLQLIKPVRPGLAIPGRGGGGLDGA